MMSVERRPPEPGNGFGGASADLALVEQLAGGAPGAAEAQPRSFGDELDDSLLESEADHEPPACTACPAAPLPLVGALRAFGPLIDLSGLAGKAVEEITPPPPADAVAAEPIAVHSSGQAPTDAGVASAPCVSADSRQAIPVTAPDPAQGRARTITGAAGNRIETAPADAPQHQFVAGERRPMPLRPGATEFADSSPDAAVEPSASKQSTDAVAAPRPSDDPGSDSRRQSAAHRSPTASAPAEGRTGASTTALPERTLAVREQPWQPLGQGEPAPIPENSPRAAVETVFRTMPAAPPLPAPQVTVTQPMAEFVEVPRASVAPDTADTIVQSMRLQYQRGGGDAVVHIKPEHLGPVSVSLRVENGAVSALVHAESGEVAEWLKSNEQLLREGLASSGLHLERFAVRRDGHPPDRRGWRPPEPPERRRRGLQPESTFEISV